MVRLTSSLMALSADRHEISTDQQEVGILRPMRCVAAQTRNFVAIFCAREPDGMFTHRMIDILILMATNAKAVNIFLQEMRTLAARMRRMTCQTI